VIDGPALATALVERVSPLVPPSVTVDAQLVLTLTESSPDDESDFDAVEFIARRFLEELQDDVMLETREPWPAGVNEAEAFAVLKKPSRQLHLGYARSTGDLIVAFEPIDIDDVSCS
jgi:hypothetical protein